MMGRRPLPSNVLKTLERVLVLLNCALTLQVPVRAQAFTIDDSKIPFHSSVTQDVEFGDIDLDGDWDVTLGNGDEDSPRQNGLWINQGGVQGLEEGLFFDDTAARLPQSEDTTFDLCLGDIDGDGDLDLHVSNSSASFLAWGNRWWVNVGGKQGGALGYFLDETSSRWVGLGQPGSSIPASLVEDGTFFDDCRDSEFADLDNDGDLDLVHSTYELFNENGPARIFLNDGDGHFQEFNPPGISTLIGSLLPGDLGLWCDGKYDNATADTTGTFCDPTMVSWDADAGDLDGDFDLDLVFADDYFDPGVFANRLDASLLAPAAGGALAFRDVWGAVLAPGFCGNTDNCQELGDLDGDGDLDLAGGDYTLVPYSQDGVFENVNGTLLLRAILPNFSQKLSADLFDYDQDGDLDFLSVGAPLQLHANQGGFAFVDVSMPAWAPNDINDADAADVDGDGDLDLLAAMEGGGGDHLLVNQTDVPDTHAPRVPAVEDLADRTSSGTSVPVRAQVYDNAPHYITAYNPTRAELKVDGVVLPPVIAQSSRGQIFRAELPGNLAGQVSYRFVSEDESGNAGVSTELAYASNPPAPFQVSYGTATVGLTGGAPILRALSVPFAQSTLHVALSSNAPPGTPAVIGVGTLSLNPGLHLPGLLLLQVAGQVLATVSKPLDAGGDTLLSAPLGPLPPGLTAYMQGFVLDGTAGGEAFASSKGLLITTQ
jgi:hypothetical protein